MQGILRQTRLLAWLPSPCPPPRPGHTLVTRLSGVADAGQTCDQRVTNVWPAIGGNVSGGCGPARVNNCYKSTCCVIALDLLATPDWDRVTTRLDRRPRWSENRACLELRILNRETLVSQQKTFWSPWYPANHNTRSTIATWWITAHFTRSISICDWSPERWFLGISIGGRLYVVAIMLFPTKM